MIMVNPLLAQSLSDEGGKWLLIGLGVIAFLAVVAHNVLGAIADGRKLWGRKPPLDEDMGKLRAELAKLAPREIVDPLIAKLGTFATKDDVDKIKEELRSYASQAQVDRRVGELKQMIEKMETDHDAQLKEMRAYVHSEVHGFRNEAQQYWSRADIQREATHKRLNLFSEVLFEMRGTLDAIRQISGGGQS